MNWLDMAIAGGLAGGLLFGAQRGVLRQAALMLGFYVSLVLAARYYGQATGLLVDHLPHADRSLAGTYVLAGITAAGTLGVGWLSQGVYASWALPRAALVDKLAGAGLGMAWSWAVLGFSITVLVYGLSFSWGTQEPVRQRLAGQMERSQLIDTVRVTLPTLRDLIAPWLPGGLPAPLSG
jgi:hypothetical protein